MTTAVEIPVDAPAISPAVAQAVEFTETYKRYADAHPAIREAMCLRSQFPGLLEDIRGGDLLAGRGPAHRLIYVGTMWWAAFPRRGGKIGEGKQGGYCFDFHTDKYARSDEDRRVLAELAAFWRVNFTSAKTQAKWDDELVTFSGNHGQIAGGGSGSCLALDLDKLMRRGLPGLMADVEARLSCARRQGEDTSFFEALRITIEVVMDVCRHYEGRALAQAAAATDARDQQRLAGIARSCAAIVSRAPQSFHEAVQLMWIYTLLAGGKHPEVWRMDGVLGDFFAGDIDRGVLSEEQAIEIILSLWRLFSENGADALCRVVIGGMGRRNPENADRFAVAAMEATLRHKRVTPQLTLRFCKGQNAELLRKAFDVIGQGATYPMLYNDDVVVAGVARALDVPLEDAQLYHPLGCGEYMLAACSPSLLNVAWSIPKSLEAALHNGRSSAGAMIGPATGQLEALDTFEKLYAAYMRQIEFSAGLTARIHEYNNQVLPRECSFLLGSLLLDDCVERGRTMLDGGVRYMGACVMAHGFTNAADALTAIRKLVYVEKRLSLRQIVAATDADFVGHGAVHRMLLDAPKFGNDDVDADELLNRMWLDISRITQAAGKAVGMDFLSVSSVNPGGYGMGEHCGATADGRRSGAPFAIGNAPTAGFDKSGLTALCNSIARVDAANGGATSNFKLSREWFAGESRAKVESMFKVYFARGGQQAMITVVNRGDLEAAMREPEKYQHVLVRLGGWSAKFVDLDQRVQLEILQRTLY